jgi:hypothetical protein
MLMLNEYRSMAYPGQLQIGTFPPFLLSGEADDAHGRYLEDHHLQRRLRRASFLHLAQELE